MDYLQNYTRPNSVHLLLSVCVFVNVDLSEAVNGEKAVFRDSNHHLVFA